MSKKPNNFWTLEKCKEEALKHTYRKEFKANSTAYSVAQKRGWLSEICAHMKPCGNKYKRLIYVYEFPNKTAYIGLTYNPKVRDTKHRNRGTVFKHSLSTGHLIPEIKILTGLNPIEIIGELEMEFVKNYFASGWTVLNDYNRIGSMGGNDLIWTKEKCIELAKKCKTKKEFAKHYSAIDSVKRNGWLKEINIFLAGERKNKGYWNYEQCKNEALKYHKKIEFRTNCPNGYLSAFKNN
jgi:hypothetical protein